MVLQTNTLDERRTFERFSTRFPAKFKDTRTEYGDQVYLRDASAEGVKLTSREQLFANDHVALEVKVPDAHEYPMNIRGEVIWVKNVEPGMWDVGLKFHTIDFLHMARLYSVAVQ